MSILLMFTIIKISETASCSCCRNICHVKARSCCLQERQRRMDLRLSRKLQQEKKIEDRLKADKLISTSLSHLSQSIVGSEVPSCPSDWCCSVSTFSFISPRQVFEALIDPSFIFIPCPSDFSMIMMILSTTCARHRCNDPKLLCTRRPRRWTSKVTGGCKRHRTSGHLLILNQADTS